MLTLQALPHDHHRMLMMLLLLPLPPVLLQSPRPLLLPMLLRLTVLVPITRFAILFAWLYW